MEKIQAEAPALVDLAKKAQFSINKHGLEGQVARVALVLDYSGSADSLYHEGTMQAVAEKVLAVATQFDDDGEIDVFLFHGVAWFAGSLNLSNYRGGIQRLIAGKDMGGTNYAAAFDVVREYYFPSGEVDPIAPVAVAKRGLFGRRKGGSATATPAPSVEIDTTLPVYVAFFTDGQTSGEPAALKAARRTSEHPIFFQSIGMGQADRFGFLKRDLNDHGGRVDNFGFFTHPHIASMGDAQLLDGLLNEFPGALEKMRRAGTLTAS